MLRTDEDTTYERAVRVLRSHNQRLKLKDQPKLTENANQLKEKARYQQDAEKKNSGGRDKSRDECHHCGKKGHWKSECRKFLKERANTATGGAKAQQAAAASSVPEKSGKSEKKSVKNEVSFDLANLCCSVTLGDQIIPEFDGVEEQKDVADGVESCEMSGGDTYENLPCVSLNFEEYCGILPATNDLPPISLGQSDRGGSVVGEQLFGHLYNKHGAPMESKMTCFPNFASRNPDEILQRKSSVLSEIYLATECARVRPLHMLRFKDIKFQTEVRKPDFCGPTNHGYLAAVERANAAKRARSAHQWTIDSGASSHFSPFISIFDDRTFKPNAGRDILTASGELLKTKGVGDVFNIKNVTCAPALSNNLFSVGHFCDSHENAQVVFTKSSATAIVDGGTVFTASRGGDGLYTFQLPGGLAFSATHAGGN